MAGLLSGDGRSSLWQVQKGPLRSPSSATGSRDSALESTSRPALLCRQRGLRTGQGGVGDSSRADVRCRTATVERPSISSGGEGEGPEDEKYDWRKAWFPVAIEAELPPDRPTAVRLLGESIVLWKDSQHQWRAFKDLCPHRLAPLSEGRVENGELMCSYHGWQFRGEDGKATVIPQAEDERSHRTATDSLRSCCAVHPCEVHEGLVWVFASSGADAAAQSRSTPKASLPKLADPAFTKFTPWFMRDLPYGADVLCENVIDPAHVPFSHHGIQGNRFKIEKMSMKPPAEMTAQQGFTVQTFKPKDGEMRHNYDISFTPPSLIRYQYGAGPGPGSELVTHSVPTDPGRSRIFFTLIVPKARLKGLLGLIVKLKSSKWLLWSDHMTRNNVLDGDGVFLAAQDLELQHRDAAEASRNYYMPASLDNGVTAFRRWSARLAEAVPWGPAAWPAPRGGSRTRREMLDRFEQHTKHCPSCSGAHKVFSTAQWVGGVAAIFGAAFAAFSLGSGAPLRRLLVPFAASAFAALMAAKSHDFKQKLEFQDYL